MDHRLAETKPGSIGSEGVLNEACNDKKRNKPEENDMKVKLIFFK